MVIHGQADVLIPASDEQEFYRHCVVPDKQLVLMPGEIRPPGQRAEEVLKLHEMGFQTVKLRVRSFDPAEDVTQVETVRRAVGDDLGIGVDANQG